MRINIQLNQIINIGASVEDALLKIKDVQILFVVDDNNKFEGVITYGDINKNEQKSIENSIKTICNKKSKYVVKRDDSYLRDASAIFKNNPNINVVPVIDIYSNLIGAISREYLLPNCINYKTFYDLSIDLNQNLYKFDSNVDLIVGIPRSGMYPALILSSYFGIPVATITEFLNKVIPSVGLSRPRKSTLKSFSQIKKIAVIDDSILSGNAMLNAKRLITPLLESYDIKATYYAVYYDDIAMKGYPFKYVDVVFLECPTPRAFQWNILTHPGIMSKACVDIDGVVCEDPSDDENDDGDKYINFIINAKPRLIVPANVRISCFVTSRLEKYREYTENWLKKYFDYGELVMLDLPSKEERLRLNAHASFKANVFSTRQELYFIDSTFAVQY